MIIENINISKPPLAMFLGYTGENNHRVFSFDVTTWKTMYPDGVVSIAFRRPDMTEPYPVVVNSDANPVIWPITITETSASDYGEVFLRVTSDGTIGKVCAIKTFTKKTNDFVGTPPEPLTDWLQQAIDIENATQMHADSASASSLSAGQSAAMAIEKAASALNASQQAIQSAYAALESAETAAQGIDISTTKAAEALASAQVAAQEADASASKALEAETSASQALINKSLSEDASIVSIDNAAISTDKAAQAVQSALEALQSASEASAAAITAVSKASEAASLADEVRGYSVVFSGHVSDTTNPHGVTKAQIGLANVDNTADKDKSLSDATVLALAGKSPTEHTHDDLYQAKIAVNGLIKSDGLGNTTSAEPGIDYVVPGADVEIIVDDTPTEGSTNPISSGSMFTELSEIETKLIPLYAENGYVVEAFEDEPYKVDITGGAYTVDSNGVNSSKSIYISNKITHNDIDVLFGFVLNISGTVSFDYNATFEDPSGTWGGIKVLVDGLVQADLPKSLLGWQKYSTSLLAGEHTIGVRVWYWYNNGAAINIDNVSYPTSGLSGLDALSSNPNSVLVSSNDGTKVGFIPKTAFATPEDLSVNGLVKGDGTTLSAAIPGTDYATPEQVAAKQDILTVDDTPTENSANPVKSGGVYSYVESVTDNIIPYYTPNGYTIENFEDAELEDGLTISISNATLTFGVDAGINNSKSLHMLVDDEYAPSTCSFNFTCPVSGKLSFWWRQRTAYNLDAWADFILDNVTLIRISRNTFSEFEYFSCDVGVGSHTFKIYSNDAYRYYFWIDDFSFPSGVLYGSAALASSPNHILTVSKDGKKIGFISKADLVPEPLSITVNGIIKGDGAGNLSPAQGGVDYALPEALTTHNTDLLAHPSLYNELQRVGVIVDNIRMALTFDTLANLQAWILGTYTRSDSIVLSDIVIGTRLYIIEEGTDNYWWDGTQIQVLNDTIPLVDYYTKAELNPYINNPPKYDNVADIPPIVPHSMDDEFDNTGLDSKWGWVNQGTVTWIEKNYCGRMSITPGSDHSTLLIQPVPTGDFTVTAKIALDGPNQNYYTFGVCLYNSANAKRVIWGRRNHDHASAMHVVKMSSNTTWTADASLLSGQNSTFVYVRIRKVGTSYYCDMSKDGDFWWQTFTETIATFLVGITNIGIGSWRNNSNASIYQGRCEWFRVTE